MANSYTDASGVYRNKLGITDSEQLKRVEYDMTGLRSDEILSKRIDLGVQGFGSERQKAIHGHLFQDVYFCNPHSLWQGVVAKTPMGCCGSSCPRVRTCRYTSSIRLMRLQT